MGALVFTLFVSSAALAQNVAPELERARISIGASDLDRDRMLAVIGEMSEFIPRSRPGADRREARYLRAVLAADLVAAAALSEDPGVASALARAFGVPEDALVPTVRAELRSLRVGAYREGAEQALFGLESATGADVSVPEPSAGPRADLAFAARVAAAAATADPIAAAARLAPDPCAETCEGIFRRIPTATARQAANALLLAFAAVSRAQAEAERGDSFARAARVGIDRAKERLSRLELDVAAVPEGIEGWARGPLGRQGHDVRLGFVVVATSRGPVYGRFAGVRLDESGALELTGASPRLPETAPLPGVGVGASAATLRTAIDALAGEGSLPIGVAAELGAPVDLLPRIVLALRASDIAPVLVGPATDGGFTLALVRPTHNAEPFPAGFAEALRVTRMGFLLREGEARRTVPLLRSARGFAFDVAALEGRDEPESAVVSYVRGLDAAVVVESALRMVPRGGEPIELVIAN
jgi:hypothetical protein